MVANAHALIRYDGNIVRSIRALAQIPKNAAVAVIDELADQIKLLREMVSHLQERVEILETRDGLLVAALKAE